MSNFEEKKNELIKLATTQQMAAANPDMSVWVEASAGTGKTKVLSDRVLRLLLAKVSPEKLLCLTYTKAAAVEMNERIAKRLSSWAIESDDDLRQDLTELLGENFDVNVLKYARTLFAVLLDTPGGMKIQTIHSFCQDILKRFPLEAGISPYFEVLDDRSAKEILQNIKLDLLKTTISSENDSLTQAIFYLTQTISEYKFPEIMNMITGNRGKIDALLNKYNGNIPEILSVLEKNLGVSANLSIDDVKYDFMQHIDREKMSEAIKIFAEGSAEDVGRSEAFGFVLEKNFSADYYDKYKSIFLTNDGTVRKSLATKPTIKKYPDILLYMQCEAERILETENKITALNVLLATKSVLYIAKSIIDKYWAYKTLYAVLDYEDLITITRKLLEKSSVADWILFKLDGGIDHILIDEAQDTSPDQWAIVRALTQEFFAGIGTHEEALARTVFVVGDRKQSIYSFQGADPKEFDKMYRYFEERIQKFSKVHLDVSFRSTKAIMDCVNTLFEVEQAKKGVVPENEHINHRPFRLGEGGKVEILPLLRPDETQKDNDYNWVLPIVREQRTSLSNQLAKQIAQKIKDLVETKELLVSKNRPIRYGDFMFLVQQRNSFVEEFVRACKSIGVKVSGVDKLKLLEQIAVQDLISLGKFLLLPTDDLSLAEVLKSPIFGLTDDDLFKLCYQRTDTLFNSLLRDSSYKDTADNLKILLNKSGFLRPFELFNYVLVKMSGRQHFIARIGKEVEDVLDEFLNLTLVFEQKHTPSLESFISWVVQDEVIIQKEMEQGSDDTVKIMTVHGSKGLQAPIVILADTARIKSRSFKSDFLWDDGMLYFPTAAANYDAVCKRIKEQDLDANEDEYRRLLYVALTRAEDRLYIAGFTKDKDANQASWYKLLQNNIVSNVPLAEDDKRIVYQIAQEIPFEEPAEAAANDAINLDDYKDLLSPAPVENPLAKPYAPSRDENDEKDLTSSPLEDSGRFYQRGTAIHKLLQYISTVPVKNRHEAAKLFLKRELSSFSDEEINSAVREVLTLCERYKNIFSPNSMAEVPIIGEAQGKIMSAKIDRLVIEPDKVIIVDYKTNRPAAKNIDEVPDLYFRQLSAYKSLLEKIYPQKKIETYILWTNTCQMMEI